MTRLATDNKHYIQYCDGTLSMGCQVTCGGEDIEFRVDGHYSPALNPAQARRIAEKILGWCDEIEQPPKGKQKRKPVDQCKSRCDGKRCTKKAGHKGIHYALKPTGGWGVDEPEQVAEGFEGMG